MNSIEEKLWNYIDGTCTPAEQQAIARLIETDEVYRGKYDELLLLNAEFSTMELDEPSMGFTYKVMEGIRSQNAAKPLKAAIDKRIIWGIAAFFIITIMALLGVAIGNINWTSATTGIQIPKQIVTVPVKTIFTGPVVQGFVFFDVIMGLFLLDHYLRRNKLVKQ